MKQLNYILFIALILTSWACQDALGPQLQDVSEVKTETKWRVSYVNDSKISKITCKTFDKNGNLISVINFNKQGVKESSSEFEYEGNTKIEHEILFNNGDTIGTLRHDFILEKGKVIKKTTLDLQGTILNSEEFIYDLNGNLKEKLFCNNNGTNCNNRIIYDNQYVDGSLTSRYTFNNNGEVSQKDSIIFSTDQSSFERITSDNKGNIFYTTSYQLDQNGKIISEILRNSKRQIIDKFKYEFTYFD